MTNFNVIRLRLISQLTVDELADILHESCAGDCRERCPAYEDCAMVPEDDGRGCQEFLCDWLREEAKDDE